MQNLWSFACLVSKLSPPAPIVWLNKADVADVHAYLRLKCPSSGCRLRQGQEEHRQVEADCFIMPQTPPAFIRVTSNGLQAHSALICQLCMKYAYKGHSRRLEGPAHVVSMVPCLPWPRLHVAAADNAMHNVRYPLNRQVFIL